MFEKMAIEMKDKLHNYQKLLNEAELNVAKLKP